MKKSDAELDRFKEYLLEKGKRETTIKDYIRHMTNFEKWLRSQGSSLKELTRYDVQQYIKYLQDKGNKATTIHPKFSSIVAQKKTNSCRAPLTHFKPLIFTYNTSFVI
ncbi:site-specific integrase [Bacillus sp. H1a]|uniref:site-specific integrase n=1 Tax=Bacillus sp. H1a TaxID=1397276 RepID=UPI00046A60B0|nr:site-specific integrase [Bacillus sp. H1a]